MIAEAPFSGTLRRMVAEGRRKPCEPNECLVGMIINTNVPLVDDIHPVLTQSQWPDEATRNAPLPGQTYVGFRHCSHCGEYIGDFHGEPKEELGEAEKRLANALNKVFRK